MHLVGFWVANKNKVEVYTTPHLFMLLLQCRKPQHFPSPYNGVDLRAVPTIIDILETMSRTILSSAFLLYQLWPCSSEDEIGACCSRTQICRIAVHVRVLVQLAFTPEPRPPFQVDLGMVHSVPTNQTNWTLESSVLGPWPRSLCESARHHFI